MIRKSLFTAVAAAPLLAFAAPALADSTISDQHTTPVSTSTANNGQPDNLTIASGASVTTTTSPAVTLDSNNTLTNSGAIDIEKLDNSIDVLILGGHTGAFTNAGQIKNLEDYTPTDTNGDGVADGPYAQGTGRYGVRVTGSTPFVGAITLNGGSSVQVEGNNSTAVSIEAPLQGDLIDGGVIAITGDNTVGLRQSGGVSGKVNYTGSITATGANAVGMNMGGDVGGSLTVYGSIQATGYRVTGRSSDPTINNALLPEDLLQSGSAVSIQGNVQGGVFVAAAPANTVSTDTTTDADKDGVIDSVEGTGVITVYGSAPAFSIGAASRDVHLGAFGTAENAYGLIIRGNVLGTGVFDGRSATGLQLGTGDGTVHIDNGARIVGTVGAQSYEADSTAIHVRSGAIVPLLQVEGSINAAVTSATTSKATAVLIDAGGGVTSVNNTGVISGALSGNLGSAYAIVDQSGQLSSVTNNNQISALVNPANSISTATGETVALDLSANTSGVTITQNPNPSTTTIITPQIVGDIRLGSGADTVNLLAGTVLGNLDFGAGAGSLTLDGGAVYNGKLTASGVLAINVNNGLLGDQSATTISASSLNVGDNGVLIVTADPATGTSTLFDVNGPATIAAGGRLGLHLSSLPLANGQQTYTVIHSTGLSVVPTDTSLIGQTPYMFVTGFRTDTAAGNVLLDVRRRTAQEAALNAAQTAAYDPIYNDLQHDSGLQTALLAQTDQTGLHTMINQMLPDHAGGVFRALSWASEAQGVAAADAPVGQEQAGPTRAWTQEIVLHEDKDPGQASGYNILGFGAVGGMESVSAHGNAVGFRVGFSAGNIRTNDLPSDNLLGVSALTGGAYWRGNIVGGLQADAQLGIGYIWIHNRREFLYTDGTNVVHRAAEATWSGYSLSGRVGLKYVANVGRVTFEPGVHADYFRLHEGGYTEHGGGDGYDLSVAPRTGDVLSVTGSMVAGMTFGEGFRWRPQIEVGYRGVLSGSAGDTSAEFVAGGAPFSIAAESLRRSAAIGRFGLRVYSDYLDLLLDAGGEWANDYTDLDVHLTARTIF